jgi:diaminohydroxyphosphoribosylaminopyrimidine deaminase/5-amino-6-(5-phosphoribosylamino)uracil reductase
MRADERFMARALELARSETNTSPNPKVGAVVVRHGEIIAEGVHRGSGTPHAEVVALDGADAAGATLYVNLEPCNFTGKTPPCAPAIAASGVTRVVAAMTDPDPRVNGSGFERLRATGIHVTVGILERAARRLNAAFVHHRATGRPRVTLKLALTLDGAMAAPDRSSRWITSEQTRARVHARRAEADAVLVGAGSVTADDPQLTVRDVPAVRQPLRVFVDSTGRVPPTAAIFGHDGLALAVATQDVVADVLRSWARAGAEVLVVPRSDDGVDLLALLEALGARGCLDLYCEGGGRLATSLLRADLVDCLEIHYGQKVVGRGGLGLGDLGVKSMADAHIWHTVEAENLDGGDVVITLERGET